MERQIIPWGHSVITLSQNVQTLDPPPFSPVSHLLNLGNPFSLLECSKLNLKPPHPSHHLQYSPSQK